MSPRSSEVSASNDSSPRSSRFACSWIFPERSIRSMKVAPPMPRRCVSRPAMRYAESGSSAPGSMSSCSARMSAIGTTPGKACGNGSMPALCSRCSLARRSSPPSVIQDLSGVDLGDLELSGCALRHRHGDHVASLVADQRTAHGRLVRELLVGGVGLGRAHDLELLRLVGLLVLDV